MFRFDEATVAIIFYLRKYKEFVIKNEFGDLITESLLEYLIFFNEKLILYAWIPGETLETIKEYNNSVKKLNLMNRTELIISSSAILSI